MGKKRESLTRALIVKMATDVSFRGRWPWLRNGRNPIGRGRCEFVSAAVGKRRKQNALESGLNLSILGSIRTERETRNQADIRAVSKVYFLEIYVRNSTRK